MVGPQNLKPFSRSAFDIRLEISVSAGTSPRSRQAF